MAKFIKNNYEKGIVTSKEYILKCIKEPTNKQYNRDMIHINEEYHCYVHIGVPNWDSLYLVFLNGGGIEVPRDCFETIE